ncbi:MAG: CHAT domain-containing protein, partial [Telluria sp.]
MSNTINFLVHGKPAADGHPPGSNDFHKHLPQATLKQSVQIGTLRGMDADVTVSVEPGRDVVVVHIANGPSLMLHPENARDLFRAQEGTLVAARRDGSAESLRVPSSLGWARAAAPLQKRGLFDKVSIAAIEVFSGVSIGQAAAAATALAVKKVDSQVNPGVYQLKADALPPLKASLAVPAVIPAVTNGPILVLVHGTFSNTEGTFGKLWSNPDLVKKLFAGYPNRVYGLEHATLGASPISNALLLAKALPQGTRLHLLTHSRGGLVAEVLARACSIDKLRQADLDFFAGPAYQADRADLEALVALVRQRAIGVERIVRVACPARGTLLASKRLDAYISVLKWTLELAHIPVLPALVEFLGEVAQNKSDPDAIPGLAAQMPDSPLVAWLHAADQPIAGELRVVAGDVQGDNIGSWVKTLLTDAYYWTDNDFVVQTSSMYGGAARAAGATFVLDRGGKVSHFTYFSNPVTAAAVVDALTQKTPAGFRAIGPLSAAGKDSSGMRGARPADPNRPAVFVIPGILGSNLSVDGERVWLGWRMIGGLDDLAYPDAAKRAIKPDGPVGHTYDRLCATLAATHDVIEFAFDWRKPIEQEAVRLAGDIEAALKLRDTSGQPVQLLAHSMGGLVARVMQLERPEVWKKMMARAGARVLMLGTPNAGSWAPMQVLSGDDSFGNKLVAFGMPFRDGEARALMARFPGFLQLQAGLLDPAHGLDREETWKEMARRDMELVEQASIWHKLPLQLRSFAWGIPPQSVLDMAVTLRKRLDVQRDEWRLAAGDNTVVMVLGHAKFTPDGYGYFDKKGLMYLDAPDQGDGRVTVSSALLPGVPAWKVDAEHGDLPNVEAAQAGYVELLLTGATTRFEKLDHATIKEQQKSRSAYVPNRGSRRDAAAAPDMLDGSSADEGRTLFDEAPQAALALTVVNGNLKFVRQPVMLGHYRSSRLTGAERVLDKLIGGSMSHSISMGLYPDGIRTHQVFRNLAENEQNPLQLPRPDSIIVVGLGAEGELSVDALAATVCSGVLGWAQRLAETHIATLDGFEMAATLIGSGGPGISAAQSARAVAKGVSDANRHLEQSDWPRVTHLYFTELYLDRATDAWRALNLLSQSTPGRFRLSERIAEGTGAQRRALETGYRGAAYDMMSALSEPTDNPRKAVITYTVDTKRAREDVRAQHMQAPLVRMLLETAACGATNDRELGRTLFKLLVPPEVEPFMAGSSDMQISLNSGTSGIPWEMLDTPSPNPNERDKTPWAIRVKLLRRLRTVEPDSHVTDAGIGNNILVIGEPECPKDYARLPGAWREASAVAAKLGKARFDGTVKTLISPVVTDVGFDAASIIKTLIANDWRIIHIAGHGAPASEDGAGGVVLSNNTFFGPDEIANMRVAPSLVFVNCCHLAAQVPGQVFNAAPSPYMRAMRAAGTAEKLIEKGVRCVIAAGWAVDDVAAEVFATTFYQQLIDGARFIDAVAAARMAAWQQDRNGTTWAAYQCYGDPDWRLARSNDRAPADPQPVTDEFAGICSSLGLMLALETVITNARYTDEKVTDCETKVRHLEQRFGQDWGNVGVVAEAFGLAWAEARDLPKAIAWTERAVSANDGSA